MKNIAVLATGGTIVSADQGQGLRPLFSVEDLLGSVRADQPERKVVGRTIMQIDSSNMTPSDWLSIARQVLALREEFDGFVITHGTDTMAYTAAALSYLLRGLGKPVVLTGSQYSIADSRTDARQNLNDALLLAGENLAGVFIVFDGKVINGTRGKKIKTRSYDAFESINYPLVAQIKHNRIAYSPVVRQSFAALPRPAGGLAAPEPVPALEERLLVLKMFPGLHPGIFDYVHDNLKAVIIEGYGAGGIAADVLGLAARIEKLVDSGIVVVLTTQCLEEGVDLMLYEVGRKLPLDRIIYARDMTTEALVPKLMWAMAGVESFAEIRRLMLTPVQDDLLPEDYNYC